MSKITQSSKDKACVRCGKNDGTVRAAHYQGLRQHHLGKGRGIKCHDVATADLCNDCDQLFTEGHNPTGDGERAGKSVARSELFLYYVVKTNIRRYEEGVI